MNIEKILHIMLKVLDYCIMAFIVTMMVIFSIYLSEMKLLFYAGKNWFNYNFWLSEYSLTVGFVSFLLSTAGLSIYEMLKDKLIAGVGK